MPLTLAESVSYDANTETRGSTTLKEYTEIDTTSLTQTANSQVSNRVWDTVAGGFVRWSTNLVDIAGSNYPGPGVFGVDTSNYVVESIQIDRLQ